MVATGWVGVFPTQPVATFPPNESSARLDLWPMVGPQTINEKDVIDVIMLLREHEIGNHDKEVINGAYISWLMCKDWGFYYTSTSNLKNVKSHLGNYEALSLSDREIISGRIDELLDMMEKEPKSVGWKLRARVGTKKQWYNDVEEVERAEHLMD